MNMYNRLLVRSLISAGVVAGATASLFAAPRWTVQSNVTFEKDFPLSASTDRDAITIAVPAKPEKPTGLEKANYIVTFERPERIDGVRLIQGRYCFANRYRILANTTGAAGVFDKVLVEQKNPVVPTGQWVEHRFAPLKVYALKLEPISGFGREGRPYPAIVEFEPLSTGRPTTAADREAFPMVHASVDLGTIWSINGYSSLHDEMFSVGWANQPRIAEQWIKPLNLTLIPDWASALLRGGKEFSIPESKDHPGHYDSGYFSSGAFDREFQWLMPHFTASREMGSMINLRLVCAPPYMREKMYKGADKEKAKFLPPKDPAEWGRLAGMEVQAINRLTDNLIEWVHIWNEPNIDYLLVPWDEKSEAYRKLFFGAAPEIRKLNPSVKIAGPVISGNGVLGWVGSEKALDGWNAWVKPFIDQCGSVADGLDIHIYRVDADCLLAETQLAANYSHNQLGKILPLVSSEGNFFLYDAPLKSDSIATRWQYLTVNWADVLLNALNAPQRIKSLAYFFITDNESYYGLFKDGIASAVHPQPIYWFYRLIRNLRGQRLWVAPHDKTINVVASRQGGGVNVVVQNKRGVPVEVAMDLKNAEGFTIKSAEQLAYDAKAGEVGISTFSPNWDGTVLRLSLKPYGICSIIGRLTADVSPRTVTETTFYGDKVFQAVPWRGTLQLHIRLPKHALESQEVILRFGMAGIPHTRPRTVEDRRVPLVVAINGKVLSTVDAGEYNQVHVLTSILGADNTIAFRRGTPDIQDRRQVGPPKLWIMSCALVTTDE